MGAIAQALSGAGVAVSFEFFPPKTDAGEANLWSALEELQDLKPTFVSVTYGAGGSSRDRTVRITRRIAAETSMRPVGHMTTVGATKDQLRGVIEDYRSAGVTSLLALRGDPPADGAPWQPGADGLRYASELVELIKEYPEFEVGVAAWPERHPESPSVEHDARVLAQKADAGADFAVTQFFFRADDYVALVERARRHGCTIPIVPGIMPVTNVSQIERFAALSGAAFPDDLARRLRAVADNPAAVREIGVEVATSLAEDVLDAGAPGLHFYTLNRSTATREVWAALQHD